MLCEGINFMIHCFLMGYHFYRMVRGVKQVLVKVKREIKLNDLQGKSWTIFLFFLWIFHACIQCILILPLPTTSLQLLLGPLNISPFKSLFKKKRKKKKEKDFSDQGWNWHESVYNHECKISLRKYLTTRRHWKNSDNWLIHLLWNIGCSSSCFTWAHIVDAH